MANSQETNVNLKINRVPDKATLENMVANNQLQPNQIYMIPSEQGQGLVAMQTKVLWENSSPTSSFAAQTVNLSDNPFNYDYIKILYNDDARNSATGYSVIEIKPSDSNFVATIGFVIYGDAHRISRQIYNPTENSISFNAAKIEDGNAWNDWLIPFQIIGIKLIESPTQITNKYSTEETVVGEWVDGKKIYRKVVSNVSITIPSNDWTDTNILSSTIDTITSIRDFRESNGTTYNCVYASKDSTYIKIGQTSNTQRTFTSFTIEYTKTTD